MTNYMNIINVFSFLMTIDDSSVTQIPNILLFVLLSPSVKAAYVCLRPAIRYFPAVRKTIFHRARRHVSRFFCVHACNHH